MPRTAGVSSRVERRRSLFRPRPISVARWLASRRIGLADLLDGDGLLVSHRSLPHASAPAPSASPRRACRADTLRPRRAATERGLSSCFSASKVARTRLYGFDEPSDFDDDVVHAERLEDGAHRAAGDDAGTGRGGAQHDLAGAVAALHVVMERAALAQRHADQRALGGFRRLADRLRHFAGLAVAEADAALLVADDDERGEAEATAALHHLGDAVDVDQAVHELGIALFAIPVRRSRGSLAMVSLTCADAPRRRSLDPGLRRPHRVRGEAASRTAVGSGQTAASDVRLAGRQKLRPPSRAASASALTRP